MGGKIMAYVYKNYRKDEIAAGLLETALELYFNGRDGFSVIHLAAASEEVLSGMIKGKRDPNKTVHPSEQTAREQTVSALAAIHVVHGTTRTEKEIGAYLNYVRNQTKHHNPKSDPDLIALALGLEVESVLYRAVENYVRYFGIPSQSIMRFLKEENKRRHLTQPPRAKESGQI
jgi:transposase-like protein